MADSSLPSDGEEQSDGAFPLTRRSALALLGVGTASAVASGGAAADHGDGAERPPGRIIRKWNQDVDAKEHDLLNLHSVDVDHVYASARDAHVVVWKDGDGRWHADGRDGHVTSSDDFFEVVQTALDDGLTEGREHKEKVVVVNEVTLGPTDDLKQIELPSYSILDMPRRMTIEDEGEPLYIPVAAYDVHHVEVPNLVVDGNPRYGMFLRSVRDMKLGDIVMEMPEGPAGGLGVRIDGFAHGRGDDTIWSKDIQVDNVYVNNGGGHAFETYAVERLQIGKVIAKNTVAGCGVLLNETVDATVGQIIGKDIDVGGGYAGFRVANGAHDITVDQVVVRGGARGIFGVSGCYNITIGEVNISDMDPTGVLIQDNQNFTIEGGVVKNCAGEAIRIDSRDSFQHPPAEGVTVKNVRTVDEAPYGEREQTYGIYVSGPNSNNIRLIDNDVRDGGTEKNINFTNSRALEIRGNNGGGVSKGTATLYSSQPTVTVKGVSPFGGQKPEVRTEVVSVPDGSYAYDTHFVWNGENGAWDLVFEWIQRPSSDLKVDYIVDNPLANIDRPEPEKNTGPKPLEEGTYWVTPNHAGDDIVMTADAAENDGNVLIDTWDAQDGQLWEVTKLDDETYRIDLANTDKDLVLAAKDGGTDTGTNCVVETWEDAEHQKWAAEGKAKNAYGLLPKHAELAADCWTASAEPGTSVKFWNPTFAPNQLWSFKDPSQKE
ncbi:MAG: RICIN domain-containing protein [Halobacteriaceae archaeon]